MPAFIDQKAIKMLPIPRALLPLLALITLLALLPLAALAALAALLN